MGRVPVYAVLLAAAVGQTLAYVDAAQPTPTEIAAAVRVQGISPRPTRNPLDPRDILKRNLPNPTCGFVSADIYSPFGCPNNLYCGVRTDLGVVGCCSTYYTVSGFTNSYTLSQCVFETVCYGLAQTSSCTGTCLSDSRVAYCTNSAYPYCMTYSYTDVGLSYFRCNVAPGVTTLVAETYTTPSSTPATTTAATTTSGVVGASNTASSTANGSASNAPAGASNSASASSPSASPVPSHHTPVGAIVGGVIGGLIVVVLAIIGGIYLGRRNKNSTPTPAPVQNTYNGGANGGAYAAATAGPTTAAAGAAYHHNGHPAAGYTDPKGPEATAPYAYNEKAGGVASTYHSPPPQELASPNLSHSQPAMSEADSRPVASTPHSAGVSELASPNLSHNAGPSNDWNRPYHELE